MKILTIKTALKAATVIPFLTGTAAFAFTINDPGVVGTVKDGSPASPADETTYTQTLLNQAANANIVIAGHTYVTGVNDYAGTVTFGTTGTGTSVPAGYQFVIAKYGNGNNGNGGDLILFLNGQAITLPASEATVFGDSTAHGLSGFTLFNGTGITLNGNPIPPAGTPTPDGGATMLLLGAGVSSLGFLRRKIS